MPFDVHDVIDGLVDDDSFFELKPLFAAELVIGFGRMDGRDASASSPTTPRSRAACSSPTAPTRRRASSGSATPSASRWSTSPTCPGFMIGSEVERGGIIRHGAKMVCAVAVGDGAAVLRRRAQGLRRRALRDGRPGLRPRRHASRCRPPASRSWVRRPPSTRSTPTRSPRSRTAERGARRVRRRPAPEYEQDVDLERLAADLVLDQVVEADALRSEVLHRLRYAARRDRHFARAPRSVPPV